MWTDLVSPEPSESRSKSAARYVWRMAPYSPMTSVSSGHPSPAQPLVRVALEVPQVMVGVDERVIHDEVGIDFGDWQRG